MFTQNDLNEDFKKYVNTLLKLGKKRGYGYWVWQTYFHKKVLSQIKDIPEAKLINRFLMLQKRIAQVSSWIEAVREDGRVHGKVITN